MENAITQNCKFCNRRIRVLGREVSAFLVRK